MPLGFERLNERTQRPNANINFIKPDASQSASEQKMAHDFLSRIAAQCYPVMKANYISVMSLEEYPPNPEFLGRNFNAGECIQLVLKDKKGRWLSFKFVQMVMMHELAHCKQMNHSRFFWNVRNGYAKEMEGLWAKGYVGEGLWGRGKDLVSGQFVNDGMPDNAEIPEHLCGGTYRRARGRKRKRGRDDGDADKPKVSYAERQQKKIARKFGVHGGGTALGDDELVRGALDRKSGKRHPGKPKVAGSKRGRELRANAALARFEAAKTQTPEKTPELDDDDGSETESGWSSDEDVDSSQSIILRRKARQIKDQNGNDMFKVCGDEGEEDEGGQDEMDELRMLSGKPKDFPNRAPQQTTATVKKRPWPKDAGDDSETESKTDEQHDPAANVPPPDDPGPPAALPANSPVLEPTEVPLPAGREPEHTSTPGMAACPICSLENEPASPTCIACSHVLKTSLVKNHWRCQNEPCKGSKYINPGDFGRCGLCSAQKPTAPASDGRPIGLTGHDVLRWD